VLRVIRLIARLILFCTQEGKEELASKAMYDDQADKMVQIGKYILAGKIIERYLKALWLPYTRNTGNQAFTGN
jgi:hypothetical protein